MGRKGKRRDAGVAAKPVEFRANPFAELRVQGSAASRPVAPPPPPAPPQPAVQLDAEDRKLLEAFKGAGSIESRVRLPEARLELVQRRGGRPVTRVLGLRTVSVLEQMELSAALRERYGMRGQFREAVLEVEGDARERLGPWLEAAGYAVAGTSSGRQ